MELKGLEEAAAVLQGLDSENKIGQILFNQTTGEVLAFIHTNTRKRYTAKGFITVYCPSEPISAERIKKIIEELVEEERMIKEHDSIKG